MILTMEKRLAGLPAALQARYERVIRQPACFKASHLFYRSEVLEDYEAVPLSFVPYLQNTSNTVFDSKTVFARLEAYGFRNDIPWCMVLPAQFFALAEEVQVAIAEGLCWGYDWLTIFRDRLLLYSQMFFLNQACLFGFINKELIFAKNLETEFARQWERYANVLKAGKGSPEHKEWWEELSHDEWSMCYQCTTKTSFFGRATDTPTEPFDFYKRYRTPYALRPKTWSALLAERHPQLGVQDFVGFSRAHIAYAETMAEGFMLKTKRQLGWIFKRTTTEEQQERFDAHWILNPDLSLNLVQYITDTLGEFAESQANTKSEMAHLVNSVAHAQFNDFTRERLNQMVLLPFQDKLKAGWGGNSTIYEILQESQNAFGETLDEYVGHTLKNNAYKSRNLTESLTLMKDNPDLSEEILTGLHYFENISKFKEVLAKIQAAQPGDYKRVLGAVIDLQRVINDTMNEYLDADQYTPTVKEMLFEFKIKGFESMFLASTNYSYDLVVELRKGLTIMTFIHYVGVMSSLEAYSDIQEEPVTDDICRVFVMFHREYYQRYKSVFAGDICKMSFGFISLLLELLQNRVDIQPLLGLSEEAVKDFSGLLLRDPTLVHYIDKNASAAVVQLYATMRTLAPQNYISIAMLTGYEETAPVIDGMLSDGTIETEAVFGYPPSKALWGILRYASRFIPASKEMLKKSKHRKDWISKLPDTMPWEDGRTLAELMTYGEILPEPKASAFIQRKRDILGALRMMSDEYLLSSVAYKTWLRAVDNEAYPEVFETLLARMREQEEEEILQNPEYQEKLEAGLRYLVGAAFGKTGLFFSQELMQLDARDMLGMAREVLREFSNRQGELRIHRYFDANYYGEVILKRIGAVWENIGSYPGKPAEAPLVFPKYFRVEWSE